MHLFTFNFLKFWTWGVTRCRMKNGEKFTIVCIFIVSCYCSAHWHDCLSLALISVVSNYSYNYPQLHLIMTHYKSFSFSKMNQLRHLVASSIWHRRLTLLNGKLSGNVNSLHALALFWTTFFLCMLRASYMSCGIWLFLWINPKNNQRDLVDHHGKHGPTVKNVLNNNEIINPQACVYCYKRSRAAIMWWFCCILFHQYMTEIVFLPGLL